MRTDKYVRIDKISLTVKSLYLYNNRYYRRHAKNKILYFIVLYDTNFRWLHVTYIY
jgi:hypothetical protein